MKAGRTRWAVALVVVLLTVAGCTGVPGASAPQPVRTIGFGESQGPSAPAPPANATPREIVRGFLDAMTATPDRLDAARAYLTDEAAQKWSGATVTVVQDQSLVVDANVQPDNTLKVTYQALGTVSADGIYRPATSEGLGVATPQTATYALDRDANGQWRIRTPVPQGLFITSDDFDAGFTPRALYFLNSAGTRAVPDLRYSPLAEPALESFLLNQLAAGPRPELEGVVNAFSPEPTGNQRLSVTPGAPTVVQVPGASALDGDAVRQLATELAFTLRPTSFQSALQIRDGTQVVAVPEVGDTFEEGDFDAVASVDESGSQPALTYVRAGAVVDADGDPVPGAAGTAANALDSAVFDSDGGRTLLAGTRGTDGDDGQRVLVVGDTNGQRDVGVPAGPLTAPSWAPIGTSADVDEVWVASGGRIYRYDPGQSEPAPQPVQVAGQEAVTGTVLSLQFSPEGSRLALVIRSPDNAATQVWIASVLRNGPDVTLGAPDRITPSGYQIADVGWRSDTLLAAVGTSSEFANGAYLEVAVDGSRLRASPTEGLLDRPRSLAVSARSAGQQWVSVGSGTDATVWTRSSSLSPWSRPSGSSAAGYAPSFSH